MGSTAFKADTNGHGHSDISAPWTVTRLEKRKRFCDLNDI